MTMIVDRLLLFIWRSVFKEKAGKRFVSYPLQKFKNLYLHIALPCMHGLAVNLVGRFSDEFDEREGDAAEEGVGRHGFFAFELEF